MRAARPVLAGHNAEIIAVFSSGSDYLHASVAVRCFGYECRRELSVSSPPVLDFYAISSRRRTFVKRFDGSLFASLEFSFPSLFRRAHVIVVPFIGGARETSS